MKKTKSLYGIKWTAHSEFHLSATLDGSRIDYWPTKSKWQHEGETQTGNIETFIRARSGQQRELAKSFCELDAKQQAEFLEAVFDTAKGWNAIGEERFQWASICEELSPRGKRLAITFFRLILGLEKWSAA